MYRRKLLVSLLILLVIGLHAIPLWQRQQQEKRQTWWPIMAWGMYRNAHRSTAPISTTKKRTIAVTTSGKEVAIGPEQSGLSSFAFSRTYDTPMWQGNASAAQQLAERLNRKRDDPFVEFRLEGESYTITPSGVVKNTVPAIVYQINK